METISKNNNTSSCMREFKSHSILQSNLYKTCFEHFFSKKKKKKAMKKQNQDYPYKHTTTTVFTDSS